MTKCTLPLPPLLASPRPLLLITALLLGGCEGTLYVDIQGDAPSVDGQLELEVTEIEFLHSDGTSYSYDLDETLKFDEDGLSLKSLIDGTELPEGYYDTINLTIDAGDSEYDHDGDSGTDERDIDGSTITASITDHRFKISEGEVVSLILHFSTFASLPAADDDDDEQELVPVMTFSHAENSHDLSVTLEGDDIISSYCADTDDQLPRLYLFDTNDSDSNNDVDGGDDDPLRVVFAQSSSSENISRVWALPNLKTGSFRLALSCDDDDPSEDDSISFFCETAIDFSESTSVLLNTATTDISCSV